MALTLKEALELTPGTILSFDTEFTYEVTAVEMRDHGRGVYINLKRDDGLDTFATQHTLHKAIIVAMPAPTADGPETIIAPGVTAEQLEALGSDPEIQQENAAIAEEEAVALPPEPTPEPSPAKVTTPKTQDGDDTAVDNKPKPKGKGKRNS